MAMLLTALRALVLTLVVTALVYPLLVFGAAQLLVPTRAGGSLILDDRGVAIGSEFIAQASRQPGYFQPRPSAVDWDGAKSGGSNLGPTSAALRARVAAAIETLQQQNPAAHGPVPIDLVTMSASGLDPHLSLEAALWQVPRVAASRRVAEGRVRAIVLAVAEEPLLGLFGTERVNVLLLNLALDRQLGRR